MPRFARLASCMVVFLPILLGLPVVSAAEKVTGKLLVPDTLTRPDRSVKIEARLVRAGLFAHAGLGGEQIDFLVGGKKVGTALTGGDGRGFLEYTPRMRGNLSLTVRLVESPRVSSVEGHGTLFSWERRRPILLVEVASLMEDTKIPIVPLPPLSADKILALPSTPAPDAATELKRLTDFYFNLMYVTRHSGTGESEELRQWLRKHGFPPGPIVAIQTGEAALTTMIESLRTDGWDNVKAGIGRTREFADVFVAQRLDVVIVRELDRVQLPKKAQVAKSWKEVRKKRL
jgi:hypothetical protein